MKVNNIAFGAAYKIKFPNKKQIECVQEILPESIHFLKDKDGIVVTTPLKKSGKTVFECLEKSVNPKDRLKYDTASEAYKKFSRKIPSKRIDTYR